MNGDVAVVVIVVASNKPNPAQIMDKLNNVDGSGLHACESCYGKHTFKNHDRKKSEKVLKLSWICGPRKILCPFFFFVNDKCVNYF